MEKKLSVIISVICIIASLCSISGTLYHAKNHNTSSMMQQAGGTPPSMPNKGENSQNNESNQQDSSQNNQSSNDQSNSQNQDSNDQTNESSNGQAPNNQQSAPGQSNSQPTMPGQNQQNNSQPGQVNQEMTSASQSLNALQIVIISISVLVFMLSITYLIMSKFGSITLAETFCGAKPTAIYAAVLVQKGSEATIKDTTIKTNASGANAVFATGENAVINVSNTKITTT